VTPQQRRTYDFVQAFWAEKGYAPSYREIMVGVGLKSPSGAYRLVQALLKRQYMKTVPGTKRSVEVVNIKEKQGF
jgi:repressor LexA